MKYEEKIVLKNSKEDLIRNGSRHYIDTLLQRYKNREQVGMIMTHVKMQISNFIFSPHVGMCTLQEIAYTPDQ